MIVIILRPWELSEVLPLSKHGKHRRLLYNWRMDIYLDVNKFGAVTAYPLALFGCFAWSVDEGAALAAVPAAVEQWRADRLRYGLAVGETNTGELTVVERVSSDEGVTDATFSSGLFEAEIRPITQAEISNALDYADQVRNDLFDLIRGIDSNTLNYKPMQDMPTVREIIYHIGGADHWYTTRVLSAENFPSDWPEVKTLPPNTFLKEARRRARLNLSNLSEEQRSVTFTTAHNASRPTELWTVRKILRRMVVHEREHIAEIRSYFATLALSC